LKSVIQKKFKKKSLTDENSEEVDNKDLKEAGSPKMTPKKKLKMNQGKKKNKTKPIKKAKIFMSAASGLNPMSFWENYQNISGRQILTNN
jgi:hypothetical protein